MSDIFIKQLDGCTYCSGGLNCTAACEAMYLWRASGGKIRTTACAVRSKTGDRTSGTNLAQMEQVSIAYGITHGRVYRPALWATPTSLVTSHRYGFILQISYRRLSGTRYDCFSRNFKGNHALYVSGAGASGTWRVADPGADGRRAGIPRGYQNIPVSLLKSAAGDLDIGGGRKLGFGKAYIYATPPDPAGTSSKVHAIVTVATSLWNEGTKDWVYSGANAIKVGTTLICRTASYTKDGVACYPIDPSSPHYPGYYIPKAHVKLGAMA